MVRKSFAGVICVMVALLACIAVNGCGGSPQEKVEAKRISLFNELADRLDKIKTDKDVTDAKPDLEALGGKFKELEAEQLPKTTADEQAAIDAKYKPDREKVTSRLMSEVGRITTDISPAATAIVFNDLKLDPTDFGK
jgi:hypothetical protein